MKMRNNTKLSFLGLLGFLGILGNSAFAQSDELNRSVTVERDFQPEIQAAGKIATKPEITETTIEPAEVEYSDYTVSVQPEATISPLLSQPTRFESAQPFHGYVRGALGHPNTLFDLGYRVNDGKNSILDIYGHHRAEWGLATLSKTKIGFNFKHNFSACALYFGVNGGNIYYHKYGHFYDYSLVNPSMWLQNKTAYSNAKPLTDKDKTSLWTAEAFVGVKSNSQSDLQYRVQTGYALFSKPGAVSEHQIRTHADIEWERSEHHVGANVYVQNNFVQLGTLATVIPDSLYGNRHNFRIEPYYEYIGTRMRVHVGVNLDLNIGRGHHHLSSIENLSFAPSPHINFEAQIAKNWLTVYADVMGEQGLGTLQSYMEENRYSFIHAGIIHPCAAYVPVDGELGFRIKPYRDLLIEIHGGYAYQMDEDYWIATADTTTVLAPINVKVPVGEFVHKHTNYQRGKVGGQINYHYRDIVRVNLNGDYFIWRGNTTVYDRPNWQLGLRVDGRIDKHWSLYSDNRFMGSRKILATDGEHILKPTIDLNLGLQYDMWVGRAKSSSKRIMMKNGEQILRPESKPNLTLFFQLNNWLHRKNEIVYGYRSQGINCLIGATFRF